MSGLPLLGPGRLMVSSVGKRAVLTAVAVDAYRNKVGSTMAAGGQEVSTVAPHLETRLGKKMWAGRRSKRGRGSKRADTP